MTLSVGRPFQRDRRMTIAALFVATITFVPAAFAQTMARENQQDSSSKGAVMGAAGSTSATMPIDLPGFPGASDIYHLGATGFFLDSAVIKLDSHQQAMLDGIKRKSMGALEAAQLRIDQAEQELWTLTGSDQPDAMTLEMKVLEIEKLKGDQRLAFIRSVGDAALVLTDDQRAALGGGASEASQMTAPQGSVGSMNSLGGMGAKNPKGEMGGMGDDSMGNMGGTPPNTKDNNKMGDM